LTDINQIPSLELTDAVLLYEASKVDRVGWCLELVHCLNQ
jgi:hypothetical protein